MLVEGDQSTQHAWRKFLAQNGVGWSVALHGFLNGQPLRHAFGHNFRGGLAKRKRLGLRQHVGGERVLVRANIVQRLGKSNEIAWHQLCALVDHLIEGVLAIGARLAPHHGTRFPFHMLSVARDMLAVGFHFQLLQIRAEAIQVLAIRKHGKNIRAQELVVPQTDQAHDDWQILF